VRLLTRTTRSVSATEAGERLLSSLGPRFEEIEAEIAAVSEMRDKPAGNVRITTNEHAARTLLWPAIIKLVKHYPDVHVELSIDSGLRDIVAERFDAGVRLGEEVAKDMIAVPIGPDTRMAVVGAPSYFAAHPRPKTPHDLTDHRCVNIRMQTRGGVYAWEFEKNGKPLNVRVDGPLTFNNIDMVLDAALEGLGVACVMEDMASLAIDKGKLVRVLTDWCPSFPGYHLYYPSRRQSTAAFTLLLKALRIIT
jgi:DNA-binding transcriptional LysR family regulator